jgi:hypothetical protein
MSDYRTVAKVDGIAKGLGVDEPRVGTQMKSNKRIIRAVEPTSDLENGARDYSKRGLVVNRMGKEVPSYKWASNERRRRRGNEWRRRG